MTDRDVFHSKNLESTNLTLLDRASQNDQDAWETLVDIYLPVIYRRCRKNFGLSAPDTENVGQEVFKAVSKNLPKFHRRREGSFRSWLNRITDSKCIDFLRKANVALPMGGTAAQQVIHKIPDPSDAMNDDPADELSQKALVMRQVMLLYEKKATEKKWKQKWKIFWDVIVEERDRKDTAAKFGVSVNVVNLTISRVRDVLRREYFGLVDDDVFPDDDSQGSHDG